MREKKLHILISKYLSSEINNAERIELENWLHASSDNQKYFDRMVKHWSSMKISQPHAIPEFEEFWREVEVKIHTEPSVGISAEQYSNKNLIASFIHTIARPTRKVRFTAFAVMLVIGGIISYRYFFSSREMVVYATNNAERKEIHLPDGSNITLNSDSEIKVEESFVDERVVFLKGEAFFDVEKNGHPFAVNTSNAFVRVTGTKFDVSMRNERTRVIVAEGTVTLRAKSSNSPTVIIHKNEKSECFRDEPPEKPLTVDTHYSIDWLRNAIVFDKTSLNEIAERLKRFYNVNVIIHDDSIGNKTITGEFRNQKIDDVVSAIALSLDLKFTKEDSTYTIHR